MTPQKTAFITGQGGSYLAEFLLVKGYIVHGIERRAPDPVGVASLRRMPKIAFAARAQFPQGTPL